MARRAHEGSAGARSCGDAVSEAPLAPPDPVLVTDGDTRQALALTRALGRRGLRVEVLAARRRSLAGSSRYAAAEHAVPDVASEPLAWAGAVRARLAAAPRALLVPATEAAIGTLLREGLDSPRVAAPPREAYETACDKWRLLRCAAEAGFDVPATALVEEPGRLSELPAGQRFPVIVKARRSRFLEAGRWREGSVRRVEDAAGLALVREDPGLRAGALVQPFLAGRGEGLFLAADRGRVVAAFAHRRLREKPPTGGVGVLLESAEPDPVLLEPAQRLVAGLAWHGVAMLELRREPGGRAWLMELNPRLWGSLQLAVDAGADFPGLVLALHAGLPLPAFAPRAGVRVRWLLGDLDQLWITWRRPEVRRQLDTTRWRALREFLGAFVDARLEVLRGDDPRPFASELRAWLAALRART
jgi:predicted ATP-grasp superfamily ATP-dependent carboligase